MPSPASSSATSPTTSKVPGGTYAIKVCATADNTVCPIGPVDLTFEAGKKYTVAASDLLAQIKADVFVDGNAKNGVAKARVVHLSADTPAVDVLTQDKAAKVVENLAYPDATGYLELEAGELRPHRLRQRRQQRLPARSRARSTSRAASPTACSRSAPSPSPRARQP